MLVDSRYLCDVSYCVSHCFSEAFATCHVLAVMLADYSLMLFDLLKFTGMPQINKRKYGVSF